LLVYCVVFWALTITLIVYGIKLGWRLIFKLEEENPALLLLLSSAFAESARFNICVWFGLLAG
jgi:hypothetical protein